MMIYLKKIVVFCPVQIIQTLRYQGFELIGKLVTAKRELRAAFRQIAESWFAIATQMAAVNGGIISHGN